jgi:N-acetylmuramate 1-kinase
MKARAATLHMQTMPRKAILLAAGYGTRMEPLSWDLPKPMMPLFGVPLLEHAIRTLSDWGVGDVLINMHHAPHEILAWFREREQRAGPRIVFSYEPDILGTGGALRKASHFIGSDPCWLVNTDIAFVLDPMPLVRMFRARQTPAVLWLDPVRGPRTVACDQEGRIRDFSVPAPGSSGTCTYCGIQLFHPRLLDGLPGKPFCSVIDACRSMIVQGQPIYGCLQEGSYWADLGTPAQYLEAHRSAPDVLRQRGAFAVFASGRVKDSVLWPGAEVTTGGELAASIAGRGVEIRNALRDVCVVRCNVPGMPKFVRDALQALRMPAGDTLYVQLPRRGSDRNFVRLVKAKRSAILIQYRSDRRPENARYEGHAHFLAGHGVDVPKVLYSSGSPDVLVLEDGGSESLLDLAPAKRDLWYGRALRSVARLHAIPLKACPALEPGFERDLYAWEHDLFLEQYLLRDYPHAAGLLAHFKQELRELAGDLARLPDVLLHRDLQSSNVLLHRNRVILIDFQGMRAGPAVYDLASLLYDPYVDLTELQRTRYLDVYLSERVCQRSEQIRKMLPVAGIQRLVQALGAFGRLGAKPETARFRLHMPAARRTLEELLRQTGVCPALRAWLAANPFKGA